MNEKKSIWDSNAVYTFISIIFGFLVGAILLTAAGINAGEAYSKLVTGVFSKPKFIMWAIIYASPLILTGLSVAFSFRTGVFNIGAEGQFVMGSLAACVVGIKLSLPAPLHVLVCILAAMAAGAVWGAIVGLLKVKKGINEVLSYIMFNWIAFYFSNYVVNIPAIHREGGGEATRDIADTARILMPEAIRKATDCQSANWGILLAIIAAVIIWFLINKTTLGYQLKACGANRHAARYAGIADKRNIVLSMAIAGALSGAAASLYYLSGNTEFYWTSAYQTLPATGFNGIPVALLAASHPIGVIFAGCFMSMLDIVGLQLTNLTAYNEYITDVIIAIIVYLSAFSLVIKMFISGQRKRRSKAALPAAEAAAKPPEGGGGAEVEKGGESA